MSNSRSIENSVNREINRLSGGHGRARDICHELVDRYGVQALSLIEKRRLRGPKIFDAYRERCGSDTGEMFRWLRGAGPKTSHANQSLEEPAGRISELAQGYEKSAKICHALLLKYGYEALELLEEQGIRGRSIMLLYIEAGLSIDRTYSALKNRARQRHQSEVAQLQRPDPVEPTTPIATTKTGTPVRSMVSQLRQQRVERDDHTESSAFKRSENAPPQSKALRRDKEKLTSSDLEVLSIIRTKGMISYPDLTAISSRRDVYASIERLSDKNCVRRGLYYVAYLRQPKESDIEAPSKQSL